jgi:prevent-host-death family protein
VGVRELRQNLSVYLARVVAGEALEVTDRGRAVALLTPLPAAATLAGRLVASGRAVARVLDTRDLPAVSGAVPNDLGRRLHEALQAARRDST